MSDQVRDEDDFQAMVDRKRAARMTRVDSMSPELKALVNEYGLNVVNQFLAVGLSKPKQIRHLVECVLDEFSPTRGSYSKQGRRVDVQR